MARFCRTIGTDEKQADPLMTEKKVQSRADFDRMAAELERIARDLQDRGGVNQHFVERIELLAKQMREEAALPAPPKPVSKDNNGK